MTSRSEVLRRGCTRTANLSLAVFCPCRSGSLQARPRKSSWAPAATIGRRRPAAGFTLIEALIATALTLMLIGAVAYLFSDVGGAINDSRAMLEMSDRLRSTAIQLQRDLSGVTVTMLPPRKPEAVEGYFEYIEGPMQVDPQTGNYIGVTPTDSTTGNIDNTVIDLDDILMFTSRRPQRPFAGRFQGTVIQSDVAEIAWFVRGRTLYRRALLVVPTAQVGNISPAGFYAQNDVSVRNVGGQLAANTLSDLTKRENRFAHDPTRYPFGSRGWGQLGLPTLRECAAGSWIAGLMSPPGTPPFKNQIDFWHPTPPWPDPYLNAGGPRIAEDVMLTNVIGFDVKAFDPSLGYVDLVGGDPRSLLQSAGNKGAVYDTWSTHYTAFGTGQEAAATRGWAVNGLDDDGNGLVDDPAEVSMGTPPFPVPLRGIQVKIRVFEPDSRQIREVTIIQDFLPN